MEKHWQVYFLWEGFEGHFQTNWTPLFYNGTDYLLIKKKLNN